MVTFNNYVQCIVFYINIFILFYIRVCFAIRRIVNVYLLLPTLIFIIIDPKFSEGWQQPPNNFRPGARKLAAKG